MKLLHLLKTRIRYKLYSILFKARVKTNVTRGEQLLLSQHYKKLYLEGKHLLSFRDVGFQEYSGTDEDGILLYIFSVIGYTNKVLVDIGCATPYGSNSANLLLNHQWTGLLLDGSSEAISLTNLFYSSYPMVKNHPPKAVCSFVTAENINSLILDNGIKDEIDFLSIDIDGIDYWIWNAIDVINPRVVVIEYQYALGADESLTIPYKPDYDREDYDINSDPSSILYAGASLAAFNKLASKKGYSLIACNTQEFNAFFIRNDVNHQLFPALEVSSCFLHPRTKDALSKSYKKVRKLPWENV